MANVTAPQFQQDVNNTADWANGDENTTVTMRLGQQADSPAKVIKRVDDLAAAQREDIYENATPYTVGNFTDGFTYTALNQRGEFGGDQYVFLGGLAGLPHVVAPATDPTLSPSLYAKANYNDAASVANANGGNVQNQLDIKDGLTVAEAINYNGIASLLGSRVYIKDRFAYFEIVLSSSFEGDEGLNELTSLSNPIYGFNLLVIENHVNASALGLTSLNLTTILPLISDLCNRKGWGLSCNGYEGTLSSQVRFYTGTFTVDFTGSIFTTEYQGAGAAWEFAPDDRGIAPPVSNSVYEIRGFNLVAGTYVETNHNCDGVHFGRQPDQLNGESSKLNYVNPVVRGAFSYNTVFLDEVYINKIDNCYFDGGWNGNARFITSGNAGENINFHGGVIADAHNDTDTGINVFVDENANADIYFNGTSIDYGDIQVKMLSGAIFGTIHMENNSAKTDVELIETNNQPITFCMSGGTIATGPLNSPSTPEPAGGKDARIDVTGSKVNVSLSGISNSLRDDFNTELVRVVSGNPIIDISGIYYDAAVTTPALISRYLNRLRNGDFETNTTTSWQLNGASGASIATSSLESFSGTYSLEFVGTSGASFSAIQKVYPSGSVKFIARCQVKVTDYTSGSMQMLLIFRDWQGNQVGARTATVQPNAVGDWVLVADSAPMPANTYELEVQLKADLLVGTFYVDDVVLNLI